MASRPDLLDQCLRSAARAARPALEHCLDHAIAALQQAESRNGSPADRDQLALAWRAMERHRDAWCSQYAGDLGIAFQHRPNPTPARAGSPVAAHAGTSMWRGYDTNFSLVDDEQLSRDIESSRLLQRALPEVEQVLVELDTLMAAVQGLDAVAPELNPVRPQIFTSTLEELLASAAVDAPVRTLWLKYLAVPLGGELKRIYVELVELLHRRQIQGAGYRVLPSSMGRLEGLPSSPPALASSPSPDRSDGGGAGHGYRSGEETPASGPVEYVDPSNHRARHTLLQEFLVRGGAPRAAQALAPAYYAAVEEELAELQNLPDSAQALLRKEADAEAEYAGDPGQEDAARAAPDRPSRFVDVLSQLSSQVWGAYGRAKTRAIVRTQLKKDATEVGQVLGLEVVRKLVNQVAQDLRLLAPVREAIVALEPALLRLAMVDPRFFSEEQHPGRLLMERVAQRSFKYNDELDPAFIHFFAGVNDSFKALNDLAILDAQPFAMALEELQVEWTEEDHPENAQRNQMLETLRFAEERQTVADQIAVDLSARSDLSKVPGVVLDFLFGPWALVMAHARLTDSRKQIDPHGYGLLVSDLIWSVKRDVTLKRPAKLIEMIPPLLAKLNEGLDLLGQDPQEKGVFFEALMQLHRPVLKLRRVRSQRDARDQLDSGAVPLDDDVDMDVEEDLAATAGQRVARRAELPWLGREDLDAAGFADTLPTAPGELHEEMSTSEFASLELSAAALPPEHRPDAGGDMNPAQVLATLAPGSWIDLYSKRRWLRAQLVWASSHGTLFMFLSRGGRAHSMTKRSCERLIRDLLLRPVASHAVVGQALEALAGEDTPSSGGVPLAARTLRH